MKKIIFLSALAAAVFPEAVRAADLPGNELLRPAVSDKIEESEQQSPAADTVRTEQTDCGNQRIDLIREFLANELNQALKMTDSKYPAEIFDVLRSFIPPDQYAELEPVMMKTLLLKKDGKILSALKKVLEQTQSEESRDEALREIKTGCGDAYISRAFIKNLWETKLDLLKKIINESALGKDEKNACLGALAEFGQISGYTESGTHAGELRKSSLSEILLDLCGEIESIEHTLPEDGNYSDIRSSLNNLKKKAVSAAVKLHSSGGEKMSFSYFDSDILIYGLCENKDDEEYPQDSSSESESVSDDSGDEIYRPAVLFMLGQDLACILKELYYASTFGEAFVKDSYDAYCREIDRADSFSEYLDPEDLSEFSGAYEYIENSIRECFSLFGSGFFECVRIFVSSLRDIVRHNSDAALKKQAVKKALAVLEIFGQTAPSLEEEVKDIKSDLSEKQLKNIQKLKDRQLPEINALLKDAAELGDIEKDAAPFYEELKSIAAGRKNRFFENNKANFALMLQIVSELLEKQKAENVKTGAELQVKLAETKNRLMQTDSADVSRITASQNLDTRYFLRDGSTEALKKLGVLEYRLDGKTTPRQVLRFLNNNISERLLPGVIDYLLKLAEHRIFIIQMLELYTPIPQIDEDLFSEAEE